VTASGRVTVPAPVDEAGWAGDAFERLPPHDVKAELAVLGGMLLSQDAIADVLGVLTSSREFFKPAHQLTFEAIVRLYESGRPTDVVAVLGELTTCGDAGRMGGAPYLHTMIQAVPTAANAGYYARIVRDRAILRRVIEAGTDAVAKAYAATGDADDLALWAAAKMEGVLAGGAGDPLLPMGELMPGVLEAILNPPELGECIPTGFADLDALLSGGLRAGQFVLIAARPALGKSTLALDIARYAAVPHRKYEARHVLFLTLEMSRAELLLRAVSAEARVPLMTLRAGGAAISEAQEVAIGSASARMSEMTLHIDETAHVGTAHIKARFMELTRAGCRPGLIVVDYLQLMSTPGRTESRQQEVSDLSRSFKLLAKELGVPVVCLAQLNRGPEQRTDKRPQLSDLRESGSLEQDADIVILLHREDAYERDSPRAGEADFIVAKHRNGPTATVTTAFQGHYSRFVDMAPVHEDGGGHEAPPYIRNG
jgi:replicative DNA helicase